VADTVVLCYHAVSYDWPADLSTTPARFESQLRLLLARGYRAATFHQAVTAPPARRTFVVTFDDAYRSVHRLAAPILSGLGLPATVFVPTDYPDSEEPMAWPGIERWLGGPHEHELVPMSWEELASLAERGWEIASHTKSHPRLPELEDDDELLAELRDSREACEHRLDRPCRTLAYPYGAEDARVVRAARAAGYTAAAALPERFHVEDRFRWPRVGVYHVDDERRFRLKVSPAVRRLRGSPVWTLLERARSHARPSAARGG